LSSFWKFFSSLTGRLIDGHPAGTAAPRFRRHLAGVLHRDLASSVAALEVGARQRQADSSKLV
jgi:hypothetical protein